MASYRRKNHAFNARLGYLSETLKANAADDHNATLLRSIWKISRLASDPRAVFCDAIKRVMEYERGRR
ncbi:MAG: hypothetical protein WA651_13425 [Candidatus Sulfotelmatobacter sp.]